MGETPGRRASPAEGAELELERGAGRAEAPKAAPEAGIRAATARSGRGEGLGSG